ncbi:MULTISPECIES: hypothetical protein [Enterococcus]|uniref:hypothetical protein n=1 Tax=Enterococcus TaxID=1350 RepID=UPI0003C564CA|nr:hypothetical protein [Enterococcus mundtii]MCA6775052.1 hypothetical protein [Enterococcus mundtii]MDV7743659.1 hypothetical protein [Enterococcus mundtii]BAO06360.1 hypothetical protein EMQU_0803 [Enterococcus mundtii QU 25]
MSIKSMIQTLLKGGYKLPEILTMKLEDLELFNEVLDNEASTSELTEDFLSLLSV